MFRMTMNVLRAWLILGSVGVLLACDRREGAPGSPVQARSIVVPDGPGAILEGELIPARILETPPARLEIVSRGAPGPIRMGEKASVMFQLKNAGSEAVWVVRPLDGSEWGRSPVCLLEIRDEAGRLQEFMPIRECANMNLLKGDDFTQLEAGQSLQEPLGELLWWWKPARPGAYSLQMTYDTSSPFIGNWAGWQAWHLDARCRELLSLVPRGKWSSDPVMIEVLP